MKSGGYKELRERNHHGGIYIGCDGTRKTDHSGCIEKQRCNQSENSDNAGGSRCRQENRPFVLNLDGVWNLVLACPDCNRGLQGKWALEPATRYLERLHKRNEFLISSHHPLRETIIQQTGTTEAERAEFLRSVDRRAISLLLHRWETPEKAAATF